jgi:hypothetical protein
MTFWDHLAEHLQTAQGIAWMTAKWLQSQGNGLHEGRETGYGKLFKQHKPYMPGDNTAHIDWKALARTDKYFIKEMHRQNRQDCVILLDCSASMRHQDANGMDKLLFAKFFTACAAWLAAQNGDTLSVWAMGGGNKPALCPFPAGSPKFFHWLAGLQANGALTASDMPPPTSRRQSLLSITISDFYWDDGLRNNFLKRIGNRNNGMAIQVMANNEQRMDYPKHAFFVDWESGEKIWCDTQKASQLYFEKLTLFKDDFIADCARQGVMPIFCSTGEPPAQALRFFVNRMRQA